MARYNFHRQWTYNGRVYDPGWARIVDPDVIAALEATTDVATNQSSLDELDFDLRLVRKSVDLTYDASGRLDTLEQGTRTMTVSYDASGRVTTKTLGSSTATYAYNADGTLSGIALG